MNFVGMSVYLHYFSLLEGVDRQVNPLSSALSPQPSLLSPLSHQSFFIYSPSLNDY